MIDIIETFLFNVALEELGACAINGIHLTNSKVEFPDARSIPLLPFKPTDEYLQLYRQIEEGNFIWSVDTEDSSTVQRILSSKLSKQLIEEEAFTEKYLFEQLGGIMLIPKAITETPSGNQFGYVFAMNNMGLDSALYIPVDIQPRVVALLKVENSILGETVHILDEESMTMTSMNISLSEYFDLAYQCKCFVNWQLAYLEGPNSIPHQLMKEFIPQFFPIDNLDLSAWDIK